MTLTLVLIRHAKSSWDDPFSEDHDRVLNTRGRAAAPVMGRWIAKTGYCPDKVLCSDAARTVETLGLMLPEWPTKPQVLTLSALYLASPAEMIDQLRKATGQTVAMVGHNPGIGSLACGLLPTRPAHPRYADYPTCATAIIAFKTTDWASIGTGQGTLLDFAIPADLMGCND
jgi:phosphohistidine phosphatase